ncbi:MAG: hypothetical protein PWQ82_1646 [Thermosediminibacterales bacterium]|nr:hypothetical protein [Thermosediminibacterales bacterium]MDK2836107.1 hypothetical protein [Thermosediminibacterales bacterium]
MNSSYLTKIKTSEAMRKEVVTISPDTTIDELNEIMLLQKQEEVIVVNNGKIVGIITRNDLAKNLARGISMDTAVKYIMTPNVICRKPDEDLLEVREEMRKAGIGRAPVLDEEGNILGILTVKSICDGFSNRLWNVVDYLQAILNTLSEGVCIIDNEGKIIYWNNALESMLDSMGENLKGRNIEEIIPKQTLEKILFSDDDLENTVFETSGKTLAVNAISFHFNKNQSNKVITIKDLSNISELTKKLTKASSRLNYLEERVREMSKERYTFGNIVTISKKMERVISIAQRVAPTSATVLIQGESGTGKELLANAIHENSNRKDFSIIKVNCSAIPANLCESEFFGYEHGAFTGALRSGKPGIFEVADRGTLFLDEIGELPLDMQAKLLRVLQEKSFLKVGGVKPVKVDVRIIAATNKDLNKMVAEGRFREDLFYRINVVTIEIPPLRERPEDIMPLVNKFIEEFARIHNKPIKRIDNEILRLLEEYDWPGNIRELKNVVERLVVFSQGGMIHKTYLPSHILNNSKKRLNKNSKNDLGKMVNEIERQTIINMLKKHSYNKARVARALNIPRSTLYYKMKTLNIDY